MIKKLLLILLVIVVALVVTIYILKRYYPQKLQKLVLPTIEQINEVDIKAVHDTAYVDTRMIADNLSFFSLKIDSIRYRISLFNKQYMKDEQFLGIDLAPGEKDTISLKLKIPYQALMDDLKKVRGKKEDSASYKLDVSLIYSTIIGKVKLPVNREARFLIPQAPEMKVMGIKYSKLGLKKIVADATIRIINHGALSLHVSDLNYEMNVVDHGTIKGTHNEKVTIKPHSETEIHIPIHVEIKNVIKIAVDVLRDKDTYNYDLHMDAVVGTEKMKLEPFHLKISKTGKMELKK